jgi:hypothetical protein
MGPYRSYHVLGTTARTPDNPSLEFLSTCSSSSICSITTQHQFLILLLYYAMESREYRECECELQKLRQRSRSPGASPPLTEAKSKPRVERRDGGNSLRSSREGPAEDLDDLHSTRIKSPECSSNQSQTGRRRSRAHTHLRYLTKDERRKIWMVRERWGGHPRYPDYDPAESSADEVEQAVHDSQHSRLRPVGIS